MTEQQRLGDAFIRAIELKFGVEEGAVTERLGVVAGVSYRSAFIHEWPRRFVFTVELITTSHDAERVATAGRDLLARLANGPSPPSPDHVLSVLSEKHADELKSDFATQGYQVAWSNVLLSRVLGPAHEPQPIDHSLGPVGIRDVQTLRDVQEYNALDPEYRTHEASLLEPKIQAVLARLDRRVIGKAQVVFPTADVAYISGMFAKVTHRRHGLGSALVDALHNRAIAFGAKTAILVPSEMTRKVGFYYKFGYEPCSQVHVMIRSK